MTDTNDSVNEDDPKAAHSCPIPMAHDRFDETHWFLHQMLDRYHYPDLFRYNTNAFLSALKAVVEVMRAELNVAGHQTWMAQKFDEIKKDPVLSRFNEGRNIVIHHRSIVKGSRIESGVFRNYDLKLAMRMKVNHDASSEDILRFFQSRMIGFILDEKHSALGEQLGVRRMYYVPELSDNEDALTASHRAWSRVSALLSNAHELLGSRFPSVPEEERESHDVSTVNLLLEMHIDPDAVVRWGWVDLDDD